VAPTAVISGQVSIGAGSCIMHGSPSLVDRYFGAWNARDPDAVAAAIYGWLIGLPGARGRVRLRPQPT
jgi:hypothetical protein